MCQILIVEDNSLFRSVLVGVLAAEFPELQIGEASNCKEALAKIQKSRPALTIVDIKMPGKNGLELTELIKTKHPETQVIILTSLDLPEYRKAAFNCGASQFFAKGKATVGDIVSAVTQALTKHFAESSTLVTLH